MIAHRPLPPLLQHALAVLVCLLLVIAWPVPRVAAAEWRERPTDQAVILHPPELSNTAEQIAGLVDPVIQQMAAIHAYTPSQPITLRLYADAEAYAQSSELARTPFGQAAQANLEARELALSEPRLRNLTPEQVRNLLRRGITQLMLHDMTRGRLPIGLREGVAQYSERPSPEVEVNARLLDRARRDRQLLPWADLNRPQEFLARSEVAVAESYAIVSFLLDRYGLGPWQRFISILPTAPDYMTALAQAYGKPVDALESEWQAYLPEYFGGSFNTNYFARYDLADIEAHLQAGRYFEARDAAEQMARFIAGAGRTSKEADIKELAQRINLGLEGDSILTQGRIQMASFEYGPAHETFLQARQRYEATGAADKIAEADQAIATAASGMTALNQLAEAERLLAEYKYSEARSAAVEALQAFAQLGDAEHYQRSWLILQSLNVTLTRLAYVLAAIALVNVVWAFWRLRRRALQPAIPGVLR